MEKWKLHLDIKDVWKKYPDQALYLHVEVFNQARDEICKVLRKHNIKIEKIFGDDAIMEYEEIVDKLECSENLIEFNNFWDEFYDFCDSYRIWVITQF